MDKVQELNENAPQCSHVTTPSAVEWRAVGVYLALACGLAWVVEGFALSRGLRFASPTLGTTVLLASIMLTPAFAAFIVRRSITRDGFATAVLYGSFWGLWHAPIIMGGFNYPGHPVLGPVMMCVLTIALALTQTALRLRYDSVFLTSFFHASINTQGLGVLPLLVVGVSPILGGITGLVGIATFMVLGVVLLAGTPERLFRSDGTGRSLTSA